MNSIFVREQPRFADPAVAFLQRAWGNEHNKTMYDDCVRHCLDSPSSLPQWYLLLDRETPAGCAGLIPNDFISRMDLRPWIYSLYVAPCCRGREHGRLLLEKPRLTPVASASGRCISARISQAITSVTALPPWAGSGIPGATARAYTAQRFDQKKRVGSPVCPGANRSRAHGFLPDAVAGAPSHGPAARAAL